MIKNVQCVIHLTIKVPSEVGCLLLHSTVSCVTQDVTLRICVNKCLGISFNSRGVAPLGTTCERNIDIEKSQTQTQVLIACRSRCLLDVSTASAFLKKQFCFCRYVGPYYCSHVRRDGVVGLAVDQKTHLGSESRTHYMSLGSRIASCHRYICLSWRIRRT